MNGKSNLLQKVSTTFGPFAIQGEKKKLHPLLKLNQDLDDLAG